MKRVFVVGCGHSGTSLMIRVLGVHTDVFAIPNETGVFLQEDNNLVKQKISEFDLDAIKKHKSFWVEKTPKHVQKIEMIYDFCPNAKIIAMVRHPLNTARSLKARGFTFEQGIRRWIDDNSALSNEIQRRDIHLVKLEDLIDDFQMMMKSVLTFLDLPFQDLSRYYLHKESWYANETVQIKPESAEGDNHAKLRNWHINQPISKDIEVFDESLLESEYAYYVENLNVIKDVLTSLNVAYDLNKYY